MAENKSKQLNETLSQIEKQFGKGTVMRMGDREVVDIPAISTGSIGLDIALGIGGCLLYTSPSPRDKRQSRMPSSA